MNLNVCFQKILGAEKELIWLLVHILEEKEALKQWVIQCLIVLNNRYQSFFLGHTGVKKLLHSKTFGAEQHRDSLAYVTTENRNT